MILIRYRMREKLRRVTLPSAHHSLITVPAFHGAYSLERETDYKLVNKQLY